MICSTARRWLGPLATIASACGVYDRSTPAGSIDGGGDGSGGTITSADTGVETAAGPGTTGASNSATGASSTQSTTGSDGNGGDVTSDSDPPWGTSGSTTEGGASGCGDGAISPGEQCDSADLQGFNCRSLGLNGGVLACDPVTCTFDTSMCMSTSGGTSG
jgi:hypothetical protein